MAMYGLGQRTTATAAGNPSWEIRSASDNKPRILIMELSQTTTTAGAYGIGRPGNIGVTPTSPQNFVSESDDSAPTSKTTAAVAWGTPPTIPANFNRKYICSNITAGGFIAIFPSGLGLPTSSSIIIWITNTGPTCDVSACIQE